MCHGSRHNGELRLKTNPIYCIAGLESELNSTLLHFQTFFISQFCVGIPFLPHAVLSTEVLSPGLGKLGAAYPPADQVVLASKPEFVIQRRLSNVDSTHL